MRQRVVMKNGKAVIESNTGVGGFREVPTRKGKPKPKPKPKPTKKGKGY